MVQMATQQLLMVHITAEKRKLSKSVESIQWVRSIVQQLRNLFKAFLKRDVSLMLVLLNRYCNLKLTKFIAKLVECNHSSQYYFDKIKNNRGNENELKSKNYAVTK